MHIRDPPYFLQLCAYISAKKRNLSLRSEFGKSRLCKQFRNNMLGDISITFPGQKRDLRNGRRHSIVCICIHAGSRHVWLFVSSAVELSSALRSEREASVYVTTSSFLQA
jgi:hypothetical protein